MYGVVEEIDWRGIGVDPPIIETEFEIQAFLFWRLRELGYYVRGEALQVYGRLDIVVWDKTQSWKCGRSGRRAADRPPLCIIEVKNKPQISKAEVRAIQKQVSKYKEGAHCQVLLVSGMKEAEMFIKAAANHGIEKIREISRSDGAPTIELWSGTEPRMNGLAMQEIDDLLSRKECTPIPPIK